MNDYDATLGLDDGHNNLLGLPLERYGNYKKMQYDFTLVSMIERRTFFLIY